MDRWWLSPPAPSRRLGGGKLEKDLEEGGGEEVGSRNQRSQKSFSRLLPRPARLNFFSAQEFSYYSEFQAAHIHAQCTVGDGCGRVRLKSSPNRVTQGGGREEGWFAGCVSRRKFLFIDEPPTLAERLNLLEMPHHGLRVRDHSSRKEERLFPFGKKIIVCHCH